MAPEPTDSLEPDDIPASADILEPDETVPPAEAAEAPEPEDAPEPETPSVYYVTDQWAHITHYACPHCGYDTLQHDWIVAHEAQCQVILQAQAFAAALSATEVSSPATTEEPPGAHILTPEPDDPPPHDPPDHLQPVDVLDLDAEAEAPYEPEVLASDENGEEEASACQP